MANILDQLPPGVEVPKRILRSYRLLILFIEGWHDGTRGKRRYQYGDDFHRAQGRRAISAYTAGYEAGAPLARPTGKPAEDSQVLPGDAQAVSLDEA